ncbi:MAG: hypothetical protein OEM62_03425 [Acidobacteriota bacterium]|nr:hypothetical protein [Acidobacteriota bacterium]
MATATRVFWETVIFLSFLVVLAGVLYWSEHRVDRRAVALTEDHKAALRLESDRHTSRILAMEKEWEERSEERARAEAVAVFNAFEAGIHSAVSARWNRYVDSAKEALLDQPAVLFVHLATPQGRVISTSDPELATAGRFDERGAWALEADTLETRSGELEGTLELAAPVRDQGRTVAFLWMGYDLTRVMTKTGDPI